MLPYGLEAFAPAKHPKKENGKLVEVDETLPVKVLEFDRGNKKIIVSHARIWEEKVEKDKEEVREKKVVERKDQRTELKNINRKVGKSTLGDLGVLSELKSKIEKGNAEAKIEAESDLETPEDVPAESPDSEATDNVEPVEKPKDE